jgi:hypothetical protein
MRNGAAPGTGIKISPKSYSESATSGKVLGRKSAFAWLPLATENRTIWALQSNSQSAAITELLQCHVGCPDRLEAGYVKTGPGDRSQWNYRP